MPNVRCSVYSVLLFVISFCLASPAAHATNTTTFTSPSTTGPFVAPCILNFGGDLGWTWGWDYAPHSVGLIVFKPGANGMPLYAFAGTVSQFSASLGSGTWMQPTVSIPVPSAQWGAIAFQKDYYGAQLGQQENFYFTVVGGGSGGGGG